jgi:hypothetical protein
MQRSAVDPLIQMVGWGSEQTVQLSRAPGSDGGVPLLTLWASDTENARQIGPGKATSIVSCLLSESKTGLAATSLAFPA